VHGVPGAATSAYKDYPLVLREHLWKIHKEVRENIQWAAKKMKENYDQTTKTTRGHIERQREEERRKPTTLKISKI